MHLVERHLVKRSDPRFPAPYAAAIASKHLYNAALSVTRQALIHEGSFVTYQERARDLKTSVQYRALPATAAQWVPRQVACAWSSYFVACRAWQADPTKFLGHPKPPHYLPKLGRNLLVYTEQAISRAPANRGAVMPSALGIRVEAPQTTIHQVRIAPRPGFSVVEVVYGQEQFPATVPHAFHAGADIGLNNLATLASDKAGFVPRLVNGRPVKSINQCHNNQFYNKRQAEWQSLWGSVGEAGRACPSRRLERLATKRAPRIDHYLHTAGLRLIDLLVAEGIGALCIGGNPLRGQEARLGKRTNQHFVSMPHARFIAMLTNKAELVGIQVRVTEESDTSEASVLDADSLPVYDANLAAAVFSGKRVKRGLCRAADGTLIHADVNGAYNIMRKAAPDVLAYGSRGCVVHPIRFAE